MQYSLRYQAWLPYAWITLLVLLAYGAALRNDYVWDDRYFLTDYTWIGSYAEAFHAALKPLFAQGSYFRPLAMFSLYAEAIASERSAALSHGINLLWHLLASVLVYLLARRSVRDATQPPDPASPWLPTLLASMFACHPALSEAVIWVSARFDLMASCAMLLALWVSGLHWKDWTRAFAVAACFLIGALCKESVVVLPIALGTYSLLRAAASRPGGRVRLADAFTARERKCYALLLLAGVAYLALRYQAMHGYSSPPSNLDLDARIAMWATAISKYLQLTAAPFSGNALQHHFIWRETSLLSDHWPSIVIACSVLLLVGTLALRRRSAGWLFAAWLGAYIPVMHIIPLPIGSSVIHQRFMYFPTALVLALAPFALLRISLSKAAIRTASALSLAFVVASMLVVRSIVPVWKDDLTLWSWTVQADPHSMQAKENLIWAYVDRGMIDEATTMLIEIARNKLSTSARTPLNIGVGHYNRGELEKAMYYYNIAYKNIRSLNQQDGSRLLANIALTNAMLGDAPAARSSLERSLQTDRHNYNALGYLHAFCGTWPRLDFHPHAHERELAERISAVSTNALMTHQPELQNDRAFCPEQ